MKDVTVDEADDREGLRLPELPPFYTLELATAERLELRYRGARVVELDELPDDLDERREQLVRHAWGRWARLSGSGEWGSFVEAFKAQRFELQELVRALGKTGALDDTPIDSPRADHDVGCWSMGECLQTLVEFTKTRKL